MEKKTTHTKQTQKETKAIFFILPVMTVSNTDSKNTCQTYLNTNVVLTIEFDCSSLSHTCIGYFVETTFFVSGPETDIQD